jgi:hypothetical protein
MNPKRKPVEGDWISFMTKGKIVYGKVECVRKSDRYPYQTEYITNEGVAISWYEIRSTE